MTLGAVAKGLGAVGKVAGRAMTGGDKSALGLAGAAVATPFVAQTVGEPIVGAVGGSRHQRRMEELKRLLYSESPERRMIRLNRLVEENRARLMATNPDLYMSFLAGRDIPEGSVYYGPKQPQSEEALMSLLMRMTTEGL